MHLLLVVLLAQSAKLAALPDTPAGAQLAAWLPVFAGGDQDAFARFIAERYSKALLAESAAEDRASRIARTYLDARAFEIRKIESSAPHEITVLTQAALTGLWFRLTMTVETEPPHRVTDYRAERIPPPPGVSRKLNEQELVKEIAAFIDKISDADAFSGTVLVAKDGKTIYRTARGFASKAYRAPNRIDTKFNLASIGKSFTAVSIMQLVESGKLSLTDPVGKFLPDYPNKAVRETVTIHHLLSHTSGLGDIYSPRYVCVRTALRQVRDYFPLFQDDPKPLAFAPGARWQYSNIGYIILGAIVEKASGENFYGYVQKHVFTPAGMTDTGYYEADVDTPNVATGYTNFIDLGDNTYDFRLGPRRNTLIGATVRGNPQGGALSTAGDLFRYTKALTAHRLVNASSLALMTTVKVEARRFEGSQTLWGYGFELENIGGQRVVGHGGGDFGISCVFRLYADSGNYTVIVLSNYERHIAVFKLQELIVFGKSDP